MNIYQGGTYNIPFIIKFKGEALPLTYVKQVDFSFGGELIKTYPPSADTGVRLEDDKLIVHLSSEETSCLQAGILHVQARVVFNDSTVKFSCTDTLYIRDTEFPECREVSDNAV